MMNCYQSVCRFLVRSRRSCTMLLVVCALVVLAAPSLLASDSLQFYRELYRVETVLGHYDMDHTYIRERIHTNGQLLTTQIEESRLGERATITIRERAHEMLTAWDQAWRHVERTPYQQNIGERTDTAHLLNYTQPQALMAVADDLSVVRAVDSEKRRLRALMNQQGRLFVQLAHNNALIALTNAERDHLITLSKEIGDEKVIIDELELTDNALVRTLEDFSAKQEGEDFHRRKGTLLPPVNSTPTHGFGPRRQRRSWSFVRHTGLTYTIKMGTTVRAVADGKVLFAENFQGYGLLIIVDHGGGYHSLYAHLQHADVKVGEDVERGVQLGLSGQSGSINGPQLYFELRANAKPVDPQPWFLRQ